VIALCHCPRRVWCFKWVGDQLVTNFCSLSTHWLRTRAVRKLSSATTTEAHGKPTITAASQTKCQLTYSLRGSSAFYKTANREGVIRCDGGQSLPVAIHVDLPHVHDEHGRRGGRRHATGEQSRGDYDQNGNVDPS
jgi:hypothetical protein